MADPVELYKSYENNAKLIYSAHLPLMIALHGTNCKHRRKERTMDDEVYGMHAGIKTTDDIENQKILISTTQWRIISSYESGWLSEIGYMYCNFDLYDGDILELTREDGQAVSFRAIGTESLGMNTSILKRFKLSNIGEQ